MPDTLRLVPGASSLRVWTYKEGVLSGVAHDLCLRATSFEAPVVRDGRAVRVTVTVPIAALRVAGAVTSAGDVEPMRERDQREIEDRLASPAVLDAARHPVLRYAGRGEVPEAGTGDVRLEGTLTVRGAERPLLLVARLAQGSDGLRADGEVRLRQTAFGITPYSALFGALKVKDELRVSWSLLYAP